MKAGAIFIVLISNEQESEEVIAKIFSAKN